MNVKNSGHLFDIETETCRPSFDTARAAAGHHSLLPRRVSMARISEVGTTGYTKQELEALERDGMFDGQDEADTLLEDKEADQKTNLTYLALVRDQHLRRTRT